MVTSPDPKSSPLAKEAQKIKNHIDALIEKMQKDEQFCPTRAKIEKYAQSIISYIDHNHSAVVPHETYLKAAIIDLTEVPEMSPQMQRISFSTALKDASHEMALFLSCL